MNTQFIPSFSYYVFQMSYLEDRAGLESVTEELENLDTTDSDDNANEVKKETSDSSVTDEEIEKEKKVATGESLKWKCVKSIIENKTNVFRPCPAQKPVCFVLQVWWQDSWWEDHQAEPVWQVVQAGQGHPGQGGLHHRHWNNIQEGGQVSLGSEEKWKNQFKIFDSCFQCQIPFRIQLDKIVSNHKKWLRDVGFNLLHIACNAFKINFEHKH